jgi:5-methylcytosine-specific restriction endonuclease McrA
MLIDGFKTKRPGANQKNPEHWSEMQTQRREMQRNEKNRVYCGTCWREESEHFRMQLHHRHYNRFGDEFIDDVILLCGSCHDAITSRIRAERYARGDRSEDLMEMLEQEHRPEPAKFRPDARVVVIAPSDDREIEVTTRFKPLQRN